MPLLGIDVGGTNLRGAIVDESGKVLSSHEERTPIDDVALLVDAIDEIVSKLHRDAGCSASACGIGFPGIIDSSQGLVFYSPNLPNFVDLALSELLCDRLGIDVYLGNDANLAALGEMWLGAGSDKSSFVHITLGTGLGSGLIINRKPFWGGSGYAAELGHLTVQPDGEICACGKRGCLEYCSASGLCSRALRCRSDGIASQMWDMMGDDDSRLNPQLIDQAALNGDALACRLLSEAGKYLGIAMAALCDTCGIHVALLGGRMVNMKFDIIKVARDEANERSLLARTREFSVEKAALGDMAGCIGAVRYALDCSVG